MRSSLFTLQSAKKTLLATLIGSTIMSAGCNVDVTLPTTAPDIAENVKFGAFNASFALDNDATENFARWVGYMSLTPEKQDYLLQIWQDKTATEEEAKLAQRVVQIRNIAAIIQKNRPDVLLLTEFNNDGTAESMAAIEGFQKNYLAVAQSLNSIDGGELQEPISYPFVQNYSTNTGLMPDDTMLNFDNIDNENSPNDAYGFGYYHGHYGFALFSRYEIDTANTRTFQTFKWKDLPSHNAMPTITKCDGSSKIPAGMNCGDNWYTPEEWGAFRLSSKNHVDAPILIPAADGNKTVIHTLLSHPTPPAFDTVTENNVMRNGAENIFWKHYINGAQLMDDKGNNTAFGSDKFVIMGDLNADTQSSAGMTNGFNELMSDALINQDVSLPDAQLTPVSTGAEAEPNPKGHPYPQTRTSVFGLRVDYAMPSIALNTIETGVYWAAEGEPGRLLFNDPRIGKYGNSKEVSSDHRFVWSVIKVN